MTLVEAPGIEPETSVHPRAISSRQKAVGSSSGTLMQDGLPAIAGACTTPAP